MRVGSTSAKSATFLLATEQPHPATRMFGGSNKPKLHFLVMEGWHRVAIHRRDFTPGMIQYSVDTCRGDEVTGVDGKMLRQRSIQKDGARELRRERFSRVRGL
jgi:hypothetical protein